MSRAAGAAAAPGTPPAGGRKRVCIISFSPLARDVRVLRQVEYLSRLYDLTVIGCDPLPPPREGVRWHAVPQRGTLPERVGALAMLSVGRVLPVAHRGWFRLRSFFRQSRQILRAERFDAIYANEWNSLPLAIEAARRTGAKLVFDAHEYSPLEWEESRMWRLLYKPLVERVLRDHARSADAWLTVSAPIAERYGREYGLSPAVVLNAPAPGAGPPAPRPPAGGDRIRLIHHGGATRARRIERMIEAVALADERITLTFMLVGDPAYIAELKALAAARAPERIHFVDPVPTHEVVARIAEFDAGFYVLEANQFNHAAALPNKFFDFVNAGLPVCIGPSPAMAELAREWGFGCVAPSFEPADVAATLGTLTRARLDVMREAARTASRTLTADVEMGKVVALFARLLDEPAGRPGVGLPMAAEAEAPEPGSRAGRPAHASAGSKKRVAIIAFSPLARDARVLRQVEYLAPHYELTVVGWDPLPDDTPGVRWRSVARAGSAVERSAAYALLLSGRLTPLAYEAWFRMRSYHREALEALAGEAYDAVLANDWMSLPAGAELAGRAGARLVLDVHEFAPLEWEGSRLWRATYAHLIRHTLERLSRRCDASVTVSQAIADRYRREFGLDPLVVLNAPRPVLLPERTPRAAGAAVRLIHHGAAIRTRRLERMIEAVALADRRFSLTFMLVGDPRYTAELKALAAEVAPGRVRFVDPVAPLEIVPVVAEYDMGLFILEADVYNYAMALPNKFFDYVSAGLPVCIGPSPAMAELALEHGFGCVARGFGPRDVADALNALDEQALERMRGAARAAARTLNADVEMGKLVMLFHRLLGDQPAAAQSVTTSGETR